MMVKGIRKRSLSDENSIFLKKSVYTAKMISHSNHWNSWFLIYLGITTATALKNVDWLENVIEVQYPALDVTKSTLVKMWLERLVTMLTKSIAELKKRLQAPRNLHR
jgi:hypothetical protein